MYYLNQENIHYSLFFIIHILIHKVSNKVYPGTLVIYDIFCRRQNIKENVYQNDALAYFYQQPNKTV